MTTAEQTRPQLPSDGSAPPVPWLVFFGSRESGPCKRVEGYLAHVLQRRRNHQTFKLFYVDESDRADLVTRFGVTGVPALFVVEGQRVVCRLERPKGCREIDRFLSGWLHR